MKKITTYVCCMLLVMSFTIIATSNVALAVENQVRQFINLCEKGTVDDFERIIGKVGVNAPLNDDHFTPLMCATIAKMFGIVRRLCDMGADVNARSVDGRTALTFAAACRHIQIVRYLLDHGANINIRTNDNRPIQCVMYHEKRKPNWDSNTDVQIIKLLIDRGAKFTDASDHGDNMLHLMMNFPIEYGYIDAIYNMDPENFKAALKMKNSDGLTPLDIMRKKSMDEYARKYLNGLGGHVMLNPYN